MDSKSPDAFRTISEVADWLGVPAHVLRFWESRFAQVKPVKRAGGRRYYRPSDMQLLGGIRKLLHEDGMTIRGVQKLLREKGVKHVAAMSPPIGMPADTREVGDAEMETVETVAPEIVSQEIEARDEARIEHRIEDAVVVPDAPLPTDAREDAREEPDAAGPAEGQAEAGVVPAADESADEGLDEAATEAAAGDPSPGPSPAPFRVDQAGGPPSGPAAPVPPAATVQAATPDATPADTPHEPPQEAATGRPSVTEPDLAGDSQEAAAAAPQDLRDDAQGATRREMGTEAGGQTGEQTGDGLLDGPEGLDFLAHEAEPDTTEDPGADGFEAQDEDDLVLTNMFAEPRAREPLASAHGPASRDSEPAGPSATDQPVAARSPEDNAPRPAQPAPTAAPPTAAPPLPERHLAMPEIGPDPEDDAGPDLPFVLSAQLRRHRTGHGGRLNPALLQAYADRLEALSERLGRSPEGRRPF